MRLSLIAAVAANGVIGYRNRLPWRLPEDLKRFKALTMGHHLLMGRKTFESIGRALPGRTTIVITRQSQAFPEDVLRAASVEEAVKIASQDDEAFVAGGAQIYQQTLARANRIYLTRIHEEFKGDTRFPEFKGSDWGLIWEERREADQRNPHAFTFLTYERKASNPS